jgi:hypothetical protein
MFPLIFAKRDAIAFPLCLFCLFAHEYNQRKNRRGAFWEDRYYATVVDTDHVSASLRGAGVRSFILAFE